MNDWLECKNLFTGQRRRSLTTRAVAAALMTAAGGASAQELPTPFAFASRIDLECHGVREPAPPPARDVFLRQLNPVLQGRLPNQRAELGRLENVCVPVAKNNQLPGPKTLPIAEQLDLA